MKKVSSESLVKDIRRKTRKKYSSEEKIRIVLEGLRAKKVLPAFVAERASLPTYTTAGVRISLKRARNVLWEIQLVRPTLWKLPILKRENEHLKQLVAEIALKNRVLKKVLVDRFYV